MARQIYGTIRRILSNGDGGAPWIGEIMLSSGEGAAYLEMSRPPAASVGDDIITMGELARERDGRIVARNTDVDPSASEALRRLKAGMRGSRIDAEWKTLADIAAAESHGDVRTVIDGPSISVIRPVVAAHHALDVMGRHSNQNMVVHDAPRFVLDPVVYRNHAAYAARRRSALPAGLAEGELTATGPSITPAFGSNGETQAWFMNFGSVESCSYTHLAGISGPGMIPKFDVSSSLAHEFMTVHEFAHSMDDGSRNLRMATPYKLRRLESFADAFAVTELALAGRSMDELGKIVNCREAAIIGLSFRHDGSRIRIGAIEHFSGAAARAALIAAADLLKRHGSANPAEVVRQAHRISERFTISDAGMAELQNALSKLTSASTSADLGRWLKDLSKSTDQALARTASSLARHHSDFFAPSDLKRQPVPGTIAELHAASLRRHIAHSKENGLLDRTALLLADTERENWGVKNHNALRRLLASVMRSGSTVIPHAIGENIRRQISAAVARGPDTAAAPAILKLPSAPPVNPNPWTFSVADRLRQCGIHAEQAYRIITEVAARGGMPSPAHQERFTSSMRSLSSFVEALSWRDATKDSKAVRRKLEEHPELEDYLRMVGNYSYADFGLPVDEGKRLQLQAIIIAINPKASLPEMPRPQAEQAIEFGADIIPATDRD